MTPSELIAAAERIVKVYEGDPAALAITFTNTLTESDSLKLARHVLATVRADDRGPVTVEWVDDELDLTNSGYTYQRIYQIVPSIRLVAEACPGGFKPCELWIGAGQSFTSRKINRGQVRDLLRALGIEVSNHA